MDINAEFRKTRAIFPGARTRAVMRSHVLRKRRAVFPSNFPECLLHGFGRNGARRVCRPEVILFHLCQFAL